MMKLAGLILITVNIGSAVSGQAPAKGDVPRALYIQLMDREFESFDANRDGQVTLAELQAGQRAAAVTAADASLRATFAQLDSDHNGQLSMTEFLKIPVPQASVNAKPLMAGLDGNGDGKVGLVEYRIAKLRSFDDIDTDKDGTATIAEMKAAGIIK